MDDNTLPPDGTGGYDIRPVDHDPFAMDPQAEPAALALPPDEPKPPEAAPSPLKADLKSWDDWGAVGGMVKAGKLLDAPLGSPSLPTREQWQSGEQALGHGIEHLATMPYRLAQKISTIATPTEPETPGEITETDIAKEKERAQTERDFGASTAMQMVLGGPGAAEEGAAAMGMRGKLTQPDAAAEAARVDQRLPTAKKPIESEGPNRVDTDAMRLTPKSYESNIGLVRNYPGVKIPPRASTDAAADLFVGHVKDNLLWLYNQVPDDIKARSSQWYDGGNKIAKEWAQKYDVPDSTVAGVIAATSPQKDWYNNVSIAKRILDSTKGDRDFYENQRFTPEMGQFFNNTPSLNKPEFRSIIDEIKDKSLADIDNILPYKKDERDIYKALWIRLHDQAHVDPSYPLITPEGNFGPTVNAKNTGEPTRVAWGSIPEIAKAVNIIDANGDPAALNTMMGYRHKVRNFYNNLISPMSPAGDVTIDTHAVAAGLLRPVSANSTEVAHNFGNWPGKDLPSAKNSAKTGIFGTYPLYADAYRQAAAEAGVLPRQLQSVTWEAVRGLFPEDWKSAKNSARIDNIWRQYRSGKETLDGARQRILDTTGGIEPPTWYRPARSNNAPTQSAGDAPELFEPRIYGTGAQPDFAGAGSGVAARTPEESVTVPSAAANNPAVPGWGGTVGTGSLRKASGETKDALIAQARASAEEVANGRPKLIGLPDEHITKAGYFVPGPVGYLHDIAERYMHDEGLPYNPPKTYAPLDIARAGRIANTFESMKHAPNDPAVKASYDAMIQETLAQYDALKDAGIKFELISPGMEDPYKATPRLAAKDVIDNKHLWVYPTETGFGSDAAAREAIKDNPLLAPTDEYIGNKRLTANDVFRIVHDVFGHIKDGNGFRARGEENAWRSHSAMYSDAARPAMTSETRGQNSWLNYGPHGDFNRTASAADTKYADQKVGLLPQWVIYEGRHDTHEFQPVDRDPFKIEKRAGGGNVGHIQSTIAPLAQALDQAVPNFDPEALGFRPSTNIEDVRDKPEWQRDIEVITRKPMFGGDDDPFGATQRAHGGRVEPKNINHSPTEAQKEAGNYAKDHVNIQGLPITIENAKGKARRGVGAGGKPWEVTMPAHYGYIKQTEGSDGDHVDVYVGPHAGSPHVYVIDQVDANTKKWDEHKVMLGFGSEAQAINTYKRGFSDGKGANRIGTITGMTVAQFKDWLRHGNHDRPFKHVVARSERVKEILHRHGLDKSATLQ